MPSPVNVCVFCRRALWRAAPRVPPAAAASGKLAPARPRHATTPPFSSSASSRARHQSTLRPPPPPSPTRAPTSGALRHFTSGPRHRQAVVNPRKDADGNDMDIEITPRAADRLREIMAKDANPRLALRITVESGGCHGFQYLMSLTDTSQASPDEDTIFESEADGGGGGAKVVIDEASLELLKGSRVDYTMELIGSQFKVVNPLATSSCGCGTSFDIKI